MKVLFLVLLVLNLHRIRGQNEVEVPVIVAGVVYMEDYDVQAVLLADTVNKRVLPIFIGIFEAISIERGLNGEKFFRPLTYDLFVNILESLGVKVEKVVIVDLIKDVYYARIYLKKGLKRYVVDSRPSDAIALAVRLNVPVFVKEKVFVKSKFVRPLEKFKKI